MSTVMLKDQRLALRLTAPQRRLIERAARVSGETLTEFSVAATVAKAQTVLADQREWVLGEAEWEAFNAAIGRSGKVLPGLAEIARQPTVFDQ